MNFLWKKEKSIISKIEQYLQECDTCRDHFYTCMKQMVMKNNSDPGNKLVELVHESESKADDLRREIEYELYNKALIPESREDILNILETLDAIPNMFEEICFEMCLEKIQISDQFKQGFLTLVEKNLHAFALIREAIVGLFYKKMDVMDRIHRVDQYESEVDKIERDLIGQVFSSKLGKADKILLRHIIKNIAQISDLAQAVGDKLTIAIVKRRI
ncbi:MAG: TIGR00153 family protein [Spirochaetales bacterium]|nr:TIGR00153 family protein [Spirochaetales bacterium]